jgi:hypothetical protein
MDDEIKGEGNSVNYKYRMHDPRLGRFFSVDPLAAKYPHNGTYNFSENRVMDAVELEGLEAFFIHGTNDGPSTWTRDEDVKSNMKSLMGLTNSKTMDIGFSWESKGGMFTSFGKEGTAYLMHGSDDRKIAATNLVNHILKNKKSGEEITLIGLSHGGNVAIQAAEMLESKHGIKVNIITVNTPSYNSGPEKPQGNKGINDMISFWDKGDNVAGGQSKLTDPLFGPYSQDNYNKDAKSKITSVEMKSKLQTGEKRHNSIYYDSKIIEKTIKDKKVEKLEKITL